MLKHWSHKDELQFTDLLRRRAEFMAVVKDVAVAIDANISCRADIDGLTTWLVNNAEQVRDALAPFDSGMR